MKKTTCFLFTLILAFVLASVNVFAKEYTSFNIVFEEKEGEKVSITAIKIFASVDDGKFSDRTDEFTLEDVKWYKYLPKPEAGKTAQDYDYVDEELKVYGTLVTDDDVFDFKHFSYFLRIARLYAKEEDTFHRNVKINGVDVEELKGICYNSGNEFFIKTITNGSVGASGKEENTSLTADLNGEADVRSDNGEGGERVCKICGVCPIQPLGICLFVWLALVVVVLLVIIIKTRKKAR